MDIIIGREENLSRLLVAVKMGAQYKTATIGAPNSVPKSVSRCKPLEGTGHCKISKDETGALNLTNLKPDNKTCVEGVPIKSKRITTSNQVTLGKDDYVLDVVTVMQAAERISGAMSKAEPTAQPECNIRKLEQVYEEYESKLNAITQRQQQLGKLRMVPMVLSALSGVMTAVLATAVGSQTLIVALPITIAMLVIYVVVLLKKDTSAEDRKAAQDWLIDHYVCPNTGNFLGNTPFKVLKQQKQCPHCRGNRTC